MMEVQQSLNKVIHGVRKIQDDLAFERSVEAMTEYLADRWLDAFGAVERERILSEDPTAIPKGDYGVEGGGRGKVGDVSDLLALHADVEMLLKSCGEPVRDLIVFLHGACVAEETVAVRHFYEDGSGYVDCALHQCDSKCKSPCPEKGKPVDPPQVTISRIEAITERRLSINWAKLPQVTAEGFLDQWNCSKPEFLSWRYLRFRARLIKEKGLDLLATERVSQGMKPPQQGQTISRYLARNLEVA